MAEGTRSILIGVVVAAALFLAWQISTILLLMFAGILIATLLDAIVHAIRKVVPAPRPLLVVGVAFCIFALLVVGLSLGGASLSQSVNQLWDMLSQQATRLYDRWREMQIGNGTVEEGDEGSLLSTILPGASELFSQAGSLFNLTLGIASNFVIITFLGLFFALNPAGYRDGFLLLLPRAQRKRLRAAFSATGEALRGWLVTQVAMMVLIGTLIFLLLTALDVPNAGLLGVLSGLLNFVPFLGPIISAVPVMLTLAAEDMTTLLLGAAGLLLIQNLEGYILTPMLQQRIIHLPPAWSLAVMAVMGALFGPLGIALATPIFAVARTLTNELYIDPREEDEATPLDVDQSTTFSASEPSEPIL
ncbi:AI-2E family transporter [Devosia albogilva]|uniref:AI-2E family transporter n=1 Tax=Devosia albogilva TaxID=429726 RepID=A0ABW5QJJ7_9HYPH